MQVSGGYPAIYAWVADLEIVANQFGTERFALLGVSQGATVAVAYSVRHPEQVSHLGAPA
jgi:pimeloyl-ACP methyl ester carboxylesterase